MTSSEVSFSKEMKIERIFETILYAHDLERAKWFYAEILGMSVQSEGELFVAFRMPDSVLLIFDPSLSNQPGRTVPSHGTSGEGHVAFAVRGDEMQRWITHFKEKNVEIEKLVEWDAGDISVYVRDPAGNSVELAPPTLWGGKWDF